MDFDHIWVWEYLLVLVFGIGVYIIQAHKNKSLWMGLTIAYFALSALRIFASPIGPYRFEPGNWTMAMDGYASAAIALLFIHMMIAMSGSLYKWMSFFQVIAFVNALLIIVGAIGFQKPWGILLNASMSGCFSAAMIPLFYCGKRMPIVAALLLPISVLVSGQSLPIAVMFFTLGVFLLRNRMYSLIIGAVITSVTVGFCITGSDLFESSGRTIIWNAAFQWWYSNSNWFLGAGSGSFSAIGPALSPDKNALFLFMHSDWLQVLFEQGLIGLVLVVGLYGLSLYKAWNKPACFYALIAYGAWAAANMPTRYALSAIYGLFLVRWAMQIAPTKTHKRRSNWMDSLQKHVRLLPRFSEECTPVS